MAADRIRVVQVGLGALGRRLTPYLLERPKLQLVAAVDADPALAGRNLGEVAGCDCPRVSICPSLAEALAAAPADVAVLTTVSTLREVGPQVEALIGLGANVVSSCEELCFPWPSAPEWSADMDRLARQAGVSVLGTGVNPGFLMDLLPVALTAICRRVERVTVLRSQDACQRRLPFQRKIGAGLTREQFEAKLATGTLRHVGLTQSMHLIAFRLGWQLERTEDTLEPILTERTVGSGEVTAGPGQVAGVHQVGRGYVGGEARIVLDFRAGLGEPDEDTVTIEGTPRLCFTAPGGVNGDVATCAILTNAIPAVLQAPPGLRTMADLPVVSWCAE